MSAGRVTLDWVNTAPDAAAALADIFEDAPWVAEAALRQRPFATVAALHAAMMGVVLAAEPERQVAFLRGHPELAGSAALEGRMGSHSTAEQAGAGLSAGPDAGLAALNAAYGARFGFPFIICVRRQSGAALLAAFRERLGNDAAVERAAALREVGFITRLRLVGRVEGPGAPVVDGVLSAAVVDAGGRGVAGVVVEVFEGGDAAVGRGVTGANGQVELLAGAPLRIGVKALRFHLDRVVAVRVAVREAEGACRVVVRVGGGVTCEGGEVVSAAE